VGGGFVLSTFVKIARCLCLIAKDIKFEKNTPLRIEMYELKTILTDEENLKPWKQIHLMVGEG